jgi:hypothetical protein
LNPSRAMASRAILTSASVTGTDFTT